MHTSFNALELSRATLDMDLVFMVIVLHFVASCVSQSASHDAVHIIPLNPNSSIHSDIREISHNIQQHSVRIELKKNRKCDEPSFIIRLSRASLYKLDKQFNPVDANRKQRSNFQHLLNWTTDCSVGNILHETGL